MQRLNIQSTHLYYDDFFQEMQIKLLDLYSSFDGNPIEVLEDRYRFAAYTSKGLYWHGLNLIRKEAPSSLSLFDNEQDEYIQIEDDSKSESTSSLYIEDFLRQAKNRLTKNEYILLLHLSEGKHSLMDIADLLSISRDTLYQRKKKIREKLDDLKECLIN